MSNKIRVAFEDIRSVAFGSITNTFALVGTTFTQPVRQLKIVNNTNAVMLINYDGGSATKDVAPASSIYIYDYSSNKEANGEVFEQAIGEGVYVKYASAPTSGTFYVVTIYAR